MVNKTWEEKQAIMREVVMKLQPGVTTNVSKLVKASGLSTHSGRVIIEELRGEGLITTERVGTMILIRRAVTTM